MAANSALRELVVKVKFALDQSSLNKANQAIARLKQKLTGLTAKPVKVNANTSAAQSKLATLKSLLKSVKDKTIKIGVSGASSAKINALKQAVQKLSGKSINIRVTGASTAKIIALKHAIQSLSNKSVHVNVTGASATSVLALRDAISSIPSNTSVTVSVNSSGLDSAIDRIRELRDALNGIGSLNAALGNLQLSLTSMAVTATNVTVSGGGGGGGGNGGGGGGDHGNDNGSGGRLRHLADHGMEIAGLGTAITAPLGYAVKESMTFESAMADVRKVVDFDTEDQFAGMKRDILELSTQIPMTKEEIAQMVAAGGQSGIEKDSLLEFAAAAAKMGVAFDISADKAGTAMAQMRTMFGMNQKEVESLSDAINHLGNNTAAESSKILEVVKRVGSVGETGGLSPTDIAGMGAAIVGIGREPEVAATAIQKMVTQLMAPNSSKATAEAFGSIGFLPSELAPMMINDAKGTLMTVFERIASLEKAEQTSVLSGIFGNESLESIAPLLTKLNILKNAWGLVADKTQYAGSMQGEYDARVGTSENSLDLLKNRIDGLATSLGDILTPAMNRILEVLGPIIKDVADFASEHPDLTAGILGTVTALGGLLVGLGGLGLLLGGVISAVEVLAPLFGTLGGALSIGFAPLLAILGLVASAIYFIGDNWDLVVSWFQPGLDRIMEGLGHLQKAWEDIQPFIDALIPPIKFVATLVGGLLVGALALLFRFGAFVFNGLCWAVELLAKALGKIGELIEWITDGLSGLISKAASFLGMEGALNAFNRNATSSLAGDAFSHGGKFGTSVEQNNIFNVRSEEEARSYHGDVTANVESYF